MDIDAPTIFDKWLNACAASPWEPLTPEAAEPYRYIWNAWASHIAPTPWPDASADQILSFIQSANAMHQDNPSDITKRRYWRVLDRIYDFAVLLGQAKANPAQDVADRDRPPSESPVGAILSPRFWHAIHQHHRPSSQATDARDKALLYVLTECAPTPTELLTLTLEDLRLGQDGAVVAIELHGPMSHHRRELPVSQACATALGSWLQRRRLLCAADSGDFLFRNRDDVNLSMQALQRITRLHLRYICAVAGLAMPTRLGAQVFRNTAIASWLNEGVGIHEVLRRAGLKSPAALDHLRQHLPISIRQAISATTPGQ